MRVFATISMAVCVLMSAGTVTADSDYDHAYKNSQAWPAFVAPRLDLAVGEAGEAAVLRSGIPLVLIRAYPDGQLSVVDRSGNHIISHSKTDFIDRFDEIQDDKNQVPTRIFLNQIARRLYDRSTNQSRAVSDQELAQYSQFLVIRTPINEDSISSVLAALEANDEFLSEHQTRPIFLLDDLMQNQEFYEWTKKTGIEYPVVVPIFHKGFYQAVFSEREKEYRLLLLDSAGKVIRKEKTLESIHGIMGE